MTVFSRRLLGAAAAVSLALGGTLVVAAPAAAATFTVTSLADDGTAGTLRAALADANGTDGVDVIELDVTGTITLTNEPLVIRDGVSIVGPGSADLTITRDAAFDLVRVEMANDVPVADRDVTISGVTFDGTGGTANGIGLFVDDVLGQLENLTLDAIRFTAFEGADTGAVVLEEVAASATVTGGYFDLNEVTNSNGAAIYADVLPTLAIADSYFTDNYALFAGGAVFSGADTTTVTGSTFEVNETGNNRGGALSGAAGSWVVSDSVFTGNIADIDGGAIGLINSGDLVITGSVFSGNTAQVGGAIFLEDVLAGEVFSVAGSLFSNNEATIGGGGAVAVETVADDGVVTITATEVSDNATDENGALWIDLLRGAVTVDSSTFADNQADAGSGIQIEDAVVSDGITITQSTFDEPQTAIAVRLLGASGGGTEFLLAHSTVVGDTGVYVLDNNGRTDITHSIVQGRGEYDVFVEDVFPLGLSARWSLFAHPLDTDFVVDAGDNRFGVDPQLGALADNGGPTRTLLPAETSPAVDAGDPALAGAPEFDQRGTGFARISGGRVDLGAVELPAVTPAGPTLPATGDSVSPLLPLGGALLLLAGLLAVAARRRTA